MFAASSLHPNIYLIFFRLFSGLLQLVAEVHLCITPKQNNAPQSYHQSFFISVIETFVIYPSIKASEHQSIICDFLFLQPQEGCCEVIFILLIYIIYIIYINNINIGLVLGCVMLEIAFGALML